VSTIALRRADGTFLGEALVDEADRAFLSQHRWRLGAHGYAVRNVPGTDERALMHREILGLQRGDGLCVDHLNRDPLDNRRANLRICSQAENMQNRAIDGRGNSRFRGVIYDEQRECWIARVSVTVGNYDSEAEAAEAVSRWRAEHLPFAAEDRRTHGAAGRLRERSDRNAEILRLWNEGLTARDIGAQLSMGMWAVHGVLKRLRRAGVDVPHRDFPESEVAA
jgi:hypothetical protein